MARWSMGVVLPGFVLTAAFPFLLGLALALLALVAATRRRWLTFGALAGLVAGASPLAFAPLGVVFVGLAIGDRWQRAALRRGFVVLGAVGIALVVVARPFATQSHDPFPARAYIVVLGSCAGLAALTWRVRDAGPLRVGALVYALACSTAFAVTSNAPGARLVALRRDRITLYVDRTGRYRIAVRNSPYWTASTGCVSRAPDGMLRWTPGARASCG